MNNISDSKNEFRSRIAPTPSGFLHLGNAFSFLYTYLHFKHAQKEGKKASLLLRIDDADTTRARDEYFEDIFRTLEWLNIDFTSGPSGVENFKKHYSQQLRFDLYHKALAQLAHTSGLVYGCDCSRSQIKQLSATGLYPLTCRNKKLSLNHGSCAWRIKVKERPVSFNSYFNDEHQVRLAQTMGDFVIKRKDGLPAYQIASLIDDLHFEINFIIRGLDLIDSTAAQVYLAQSMQHANFTSATFLHHPLVFEDSGKKMSKSHKSLSLKEIRTQYPKPLKVYQAFGKIIGIQQPIKDLPSLIELFDPHKHQFKQNVFLKDLLPY